MKHWVMDYETLSNCFTGVFEHYKTTERKIFVVHDLRNDLDSFISFLEENINNKEWHISYNGLAFDGQVTHYILDNHHTSNSQGFRSLSIGMLTSNDYMGYRNIYFRSPNNNKNLETKPQDNIELFIDDDDNINLIKNDKNKYLLGLIGNNFIIDMINNNNIFEIFINNFNKRMADMMNKQ